MTPTRAAAVTGLLFVAVTALVAARVSWLVTDVDHRLAGDVVGWVGPHPGLQTTLRVLTWIGHPLVVDALVLVAAAALWRGRRRASAVALLATGVVSLLVRSTVKTLVDRPRPVGGFSTATGGSFPSGHTAGAAFVAVAAVVVLHRAWVGVVAAAYALLVAATRVLLDVHWFSDVVGGLLVGATFALLLPWARSRLLTHGGERLRVEALP